MPGQIDIGMEIADLKKLLIRSKREPVNCAIGLSKDGVPKIHVDKIKKPRACLAELTKSHGSLKMPGFGSMHVDVDEDPKLVILTLNKPAPGFGRKFKKGLRGTGFTKIMIMHEDGSPAEQIGEDEDEGDEQQGAETAGGEAETTDATPQLDTGGDTTTATETTSTSFDAAGLTHRLTAAVKLMLPVIAANPSMRDDLKTLAESAQAAIKSANSGAEDVIQQLELAIDEARQGGQSGAPGGQADGTQTGAAQAGAAPGDGTQADGKQAALRSVPKLWMDTIKTMEADCHKLKDAIRKDFADQPREVIADIEKNFDRIDQVCERFDRRLADLLLDAAEAPDQASRTAALTKVRTAVAAQVKWAATDPVIGLLDDNPFGVSMGIKQRLASVLGQVNEASRLN
jgi:hypothetical protein